MEPVTHLWGHYNDVRENLSAPRVTNLNSLALILQEGWHNLSSNILAQYEDVQEQIWVVKETMSTVRLSNSELFLLTMRKGAHDLALAVSEWREETSLRTQLVLAALTALVVALLLDNTISRLTSISRRGIPILKRPKGVSRWDYEALLNEGARLYPNTPYIITYSGYEYIVYPSSSFDEIKRLSSTQASMLEWFTHVFFQGWRFLGHENSGLYKTVGVDLARAVSARVQQRQEHARFAFKSAVGNCAEWKSFPLFNGAQEIIALTNASGLVGPKLGRNKKWTNAVQRFPVAMMVAIFSCHAVPRVLRPLASFIAFIPAWSLYWYMRILLAPAVAQDLGQHEAEKCERKDAQLLAKSTGKFPLTSWLMRRYKPEDANASQVAHDLIVASFESTPSMAATLYFIIAELTTRLELVEELREELHQFMVDGKLPQTSLAELRKLDSVMRESSRVNPFSYLTLFRRLRQPVQLSTGPPLPVGALICVDAHHIVTSHDLWPNPETFEPLRFYKMRQQAGHESQHQFTSLGSDSPGWGDGLQACPGRFFAGNTLKIILADLLLNYDFCLPPGGEKPKRNSMPNGSIAPDLGAKILIRERNQ